MRCLGSYAGMESSMKIKECCLRIKIPHCLEKEKKKTGSRDLRMYVNPYFVYVLDHDELENINLVKRSRRNEPIRPPKRKRHPKVPCNTEEKKAVFSLFGTHIRQGKTPGKAICETCRQNNPCLRRQKESGQQ